MITDLDYRLKLEDRIDKLAEENMQLKEENRKLKERIIMPPAHKVKWIAMDDVSFARRVDEKTLIEMKKIDEAVYQYIKGRLLHD